MGFVTKTQQILQNVLPRWSVGESVRSQQDSLLRILAVAHSDQLDCKTLIGNLATEHADSYGRKLKSLRRWIAAESSIAVALTHTPGALSDDDTLAIKCASETGTLNETFSFLTQHRDSEKESSVSESLSGSLAYILFVSMFVGFLILFLVLYILPTMIEIFEDFALQMPPVMDSLVHFIDHYWGLGILVLILLVAFVLAIQSVDVQRSFSQTWLGQRLFGMRKHHAAGILKLLAIPSSNGHPLGPTLTAAAQFHPSPRLRKQLLSVRTNSDSDQDVWQQLAEHRLITRNEGQQLQAVVDPRLRAWVLSTLADRRHHKATARTELLARVGQYIPVLILSGLVGWIVIAVIQTLTTMITVLT